MENNKEIKSKEKSVKRSRFFPFIKVVYENLPDGLIAGIMVFAAISVLFLTGLLIDQFDIFSDFLFFVSLNKWMNDGTAWHWAGLACLRIFVGLCTLIAGSFVWFLLSYVYKLFESVVVFFKICWKVSGMPKYREEITFENTKEALLWLQDYISVKKKGEYRFTKNMPQQARDMIRSILSDDIEKIHESQVESIPLVIHFGYLEEIKNMYIPG